MKTPCGRQYCNISLRKCVSNFELWTMSKNAYLLLHCAVLTLSGGEYTQEHKFSSEKWKVSTCSDRKRAESVHSAQRRSTQNLQCQPPRFPPRQAGQAKSIIKNNLNCSAQHNRGICAPAVSDPRRLCDGDGDKYSESRDAYCKARRSAVRGQPSVHTQYGQQL